MPVRASLRRPFAAEAPKALPRAPRVTAQPYKAPHMDVRASGVRAASVYSTALRVMFNIKTTQWRETKIRKQLGLPPEQEDDDANHPRIEALWEDTHERNAKVR